MNRSDPSGLDCVLWGNYRVRYEDGAEVSRTLLSTFRVGDCDGIGESENGFAASPPFGDTQQPQLCSFTMTSVEWRAGIDAYRRSLRVGTEQGNFTFSAQSTFVNIVPTRSDSMGMSFRWPDPTPAAQFHGHLRFIDPATGISIDQTYGRASREDSLLANRRGVPVYAFSRDSVSRVAPGGPIVTCSRSSVRRTP